MGETSGTGPFTTISGGKLQSIFSPTAAVFDLGSSTTSCGTPPTAVTFNFVMWNADVGGPTRTLDLPLLSGAYPASASRVAPPLLLGSLDAGLIGMSPNETESNPWSPLFPSRALSAPPPRIPGFEAGPYVTALVSQARIHQSSTARHAETRRNSSTCLSAKGVGAGGVKIGLPPRAPSYAPVSKLPLPRPTTMLLSRAGISTTLSLICVPSIFLIRIVAVRRKEQMA
jgi:hypothetical protein